MQFIISLLVALVALAIVIKLFSLGMWLLWTLLVGLFVGGLARVFVSGTRDMSVAATALYGIGGSLSGKLIAGLLGLGGLLSLAVSVACAALLIGGLHAGRS